MINCVLIYGFDSPEHDVSVVTATEIMKNAPSRGIRLYPVYVRGGAWYTGAALSDLRSYSPFEPSAHRAVKIAGRTLYIEKRGKLKAFAPIDCALIAAHGGFGENGALQGFLDVNGIPYCSSGVFSSAVGMNKAAAKTLARAAGIPVADWRTANRENIDAELENAAAEIGYPLMIKPLSSGSSLGICAAHSALEAECAAEKAFGFSDEVIIEKYLPDAVDINVAVLKTGEEVRFSRPERPIKSGEILSFNDKYAPTARASEFPADIPPEKEAELIRLTARAAKTFQTDGAVRFDYLLADDKIYFNEINTVPGSLAAYLFPEYKPTEYIRLIIETAAAKGGAPVGVDYDTGLLRLKPKGRR